jgi:hypothetical protein
MKIILPTRTLSELPADKGICILGTEPPNERPGVVFTFDSRGSIVSGGQAVRALRFSRQFGSNRFFREWSAAHREQLQRLTRALGLEVKAVLREEGLEAAERILWQQVLLSEGLSMSRGLGNLVYCGFSDVLDQFQPQLDGSPSKRLQRLGADHHYARIWNRSDLLDFEG